MASHQMALIPGRVTSLSTDVLSEDDIAATLRFADAAQARNTRLGYASDWRAFTAWCDGRGAPALPCPPAVVCAYLSSMAERGHRASTITHHLASIGDMHRRHGHLSPTSHEAVRQVIRGIRRSLGTAASRKQAATADLVRRMMDACPDTLAGLRDRALLAIALAGAFRRSELVALQVEDIQQVEEGLRITIRRSKTDQTGQGQHVSIPHGSRIRPVVALRAWMDAAGIKDGPVFRAVTQRGRVATTPLTGDGYVRMIKKRARQAGIDPANLSGHSMRSGFMTSAAAGGASLPKMMEQSRHRSVDVAMGYIRDRDAWRDHAGATFL